MFEAPVGWKEVAIGDVVTLQRGFDITKQQQSPGQVPVVSSGGVSSWHDTSMAKGPGVILGRKGTLGRTYFVESDYWPHDTTLWVCDFKGNDPRFVYNFFSSLDFRYLDVGSANPTLNRNHVHPLRVLWPPLNEQLSIAEVLGALEETAENQRRIATLCWQMALALYEEEVEKAATLVTVGTVADFHNRRRVPLSARERSMRPGEFPYHGAAGIVDSVDAFLFDGVYVLVGEDGTVTTNGVHPVVQYVWGKFWVNNHAHVLTGKGLSQEMLRCALAKSDVSAALTGAVQPKLSMGNLKAVTLRVPAHPERIEAKLRVLAETERACHRQSRAAVTLRDTLRPALLSGRLRVKEAQALAGLRG